MVRDAYARVGSQKIPLFLQVMGFILLTSLLFHILSGDSGLILLQVLLSGMAVLWLIKRPHWGVLIVLTMWLTRFSPPLLGINQLRAPYVISAISLIPLILAMWRDREVWVWRVPQVKIFLAIGLIFLISILWNDYKHPITLIPEFDNTTEMAQQFGTRVVFLVLFLYFINTRQRLELAAWVLMLIIVASSISALYNMLMPGLGRAWASFGVGRNPNRLAFLCVMGASLLWFFRAYAPTKRGKTLALLLLLPLPAIVLASGSRGGLVQLVALVALIFKEQEGWSIMKRVRSMFLLGAVSLLVLTVVPATTLLRATTFESSRSALGGESFSNRLKTIYAGLEMLAQDPILGIGLGNFLWMNQAYYGGDQPPHNSYLSALLYGGIGALVLYLLMFSITYRMLKQLERYGPREMLWLVKGLKIALFLFMLASVSADLWFEDFTYCIVGLTVALLHVSQRQRQEKSLPDPDPTSFSSYWYAAHVERAKA
jgi:O-antigen ligase